MLHIYVLKQYELTISLLLLDTDNKETKQIFFKHSSNVL